MSDNSTQYLKDYQSPDFTIEEIDLTFTLNEQSTTVEATSQVIRLREGKALVLDGEDLELISVAINGQALAATQYQLGATQLEIRDLPATFELTIVTQLNPSNNTKLEGLYVSDGAFCSQCEAQGFRRITYYLDRPDVMAVFTTKLIADRAKFPYLLSNGNKIDQGLLDDGRHFAQWHDPHKKPAYLFAIVAGDFDLLTDTFTTRSKREVALEFFVDKGNKHKATHAMASLKRSMAWDEQRFGLEYDLDIYMVVAVDFFNMGAMENKGLNVFNSKYVLADNDSATDVDFHGIESVIGHEYFHNWTGNRITCRDWFQLSLKEGLTVFRDQEFSSDVGSRAVNRIDAVKVIRSHQFSEDAGPMSHPIRPFAVIEMNNFYTVTVYNKGAEVIRMIHTLVGESRFQLGMQQYVKRFDGQAVTCDDFIDAMEQGAGIDLSQFKHWYSQSGTPTVKIEQQYEAVSKELTLTLSQSLPRGNNKAPLQPFHIPVRIEVLNQAGDSLLLDGLHDSMILALTEQTQTFVLTDIPAEHTAVFFGDFSAPVKTDYVMSQRQLTHTLAHSNNDFSRWDSAQQLLTQCIVDNMQLSGNERHIDQALITSLASVLDNKQLDPALVALMLEMPSIGTLFELEEQVDVDVIIAARDYVNVALAHALAPQLISCYQDCKAKISVNEPDVVALRALKNSVLVLISHLDNATSYDIINSQGQHAQNMTDSISALSCASQSGAPCLNGLSSAFEGRWSDNGLVMDKWFATIGSNPSSDVIEKIKQTFDHPSFSWQNPNRVRSLIASFAMNNQRQFHRIDGLGYEFLTDQLIALNDINPQIAARLITPLMSWKKIKGERAQLMRAQLVRLQQIPNLAKDLVEKVQLSLA